MKNRAFAIAINADLSDVELTQMLSSNLPKRRWGNYYVEILPDDDPEFDWVFQAQAKTRDVSESDALDLFLSIKQILQDCGYKTDDASFK